MFADVLLKRTEVPFGEDLSQEVGMRNWLVAVWSDWMAAVVLGAFSLVTAARWSGSST